jgi:hypothetical protein
LRNKDKWKKQKKKDIIFSPSKGKYNKGNQRNFSVMNAVQKSAFMIEKNIYI